jgi:hypothetical protein
MVILHDITLLPNHSSEEQDHSIAPFSEAPSYAPFPSDNGREGGTRIEVYLMVFTHALGARLMMAGQERSVLQCQATIIG